MIIAITAKEPTLESEVDPRFGRAAYFLIVNTMIGKAFALENSEGINASNGAGTGAAQLMAENKVDVLYTGSVGPKAGDALEKAQIKVHENTTGTIKDILDLLTSEMNEKAGEDEPMEFVEPPVNDAVRLAIPADSGDGLHANRAGHFGKCAYYILVDVKDNQVQQITPLRNGGHSKGGCSVPVKLLNGNHVKQLIVAGIGGRPLQGFRETGIEVYAGEGQTVEETVNHFLNNKLVPIGNDQVCSGGPQ